MCVLLVFLFQSYIIYHIDFGITLYCNCQISCHQLSIVNCQYGTVYRYTVCCFDLWEVWKCWIFFSVTFQISLVRRQQYFGHFDALKLLDVCRLNFEIGYHWWSIVNVTILWICLSLPCERFDLSIIQTFQIILYCRWDFDFRCRCHASELSWSFCQGELVKKLQRYLFVMKCRERLRLGLRCGKHPRTLDWLARCEDSRLN